MAIYYARKTGNVNAVDVWSTTPTGTAGDYFPSFTNTDTLVANSFTITLNVNTTVLEVRRDTTGGATAGGTFTLSPNLRFNGNIIGNGNTSNSSLFNINLATGQTATINGNITGGSANGTENGLSFIGTGGTLTINGNIISGVNSAAISVSNSMGTMNIVGDICYDANGSNGISVTNNSIINITGNVYGSGIAGGNGYGLYLQGVGSTINITGNIIGLSRSTYGAIRLLAGTLNITGNVGPPINESQALISITASAANPILTITGNVYGGNATANIGISIGGPSTVTIIGSCIAGNLGIALNNNSTSTATITRAKGNNFGNGSIGMNSIVGVAASQNSTTKVNEIEYGDLGQSPTSGPISFVNDSSNKALFYRPGLTKKTLVDSAASLDLPAASNVRSGISYNFGSNTGTCAIPPANSVAYGVAVDNTTGTATLTPQSIWDILTSNISASNSIGERLKNAATIDSVSSQVITIKGA